MGNEEFRSAVICGRHSYKRWRDEGYFHSGPSSAHVQLSVSSDEGATVVGCSTLHLIRNLALSCSTLERRETVNSISSVRQQTYGLNGTAESALEANFLEDSSADCDFLTS